MLILVVGPSGAGKDTLLNHARAALAHDPRFRFVRRVITRPSEAGGEDHESVSETEFLRRDFALQWQAHGLRYGIPTDIADDLARGVHVVANVSRSIIADASQRFPTRVVEVTAPAAILTARLQLRAREEAGDIERRLSREVAIPPGTDVITVMNDSTVSEGAARFVAALRQAAAR